MPIYMDVHIVPGVKAREVAKAHHQDLMLQDQYGCKCMTYWVDEHRETIFCLVDAVNKDAVKELHSKAHGMVPNKIIEVSSAVVESFLGRIYDPEEVMIEEGLKVFSDAPYRFILVLRSEDPVLLWHRMGNEEANNLVSRYHETVKKHCHHQQGSEAEHRGDGFLLSFTSAAKAFACAIAILTDIPPAEKEILNLKAAIDGGQPVENSNEFFGDTLSSVSSLVSVTPAGHIALTVSVKEILAKESRLKSVNALFFIKPEEEEFLQSLYNNIEKQWHNPCFDIPEYAQAMAVSQSKLYRKVTGVTGESCNTLLKNFRLAKAKELLKKRKFSIAQVTFECGFTSPSYFTKCFKARYGLLPNTYLSLLS